ncbi:MAG TPA: hypothetical protein VIQ30_02050 [Pseudonocardia sp.]
MVCGDGLEITADRARLPPDSVAEFASGVDPLVSDGVDEFEIVRSVVELVVVLVVDLEPGRDRSSVLPFPDLDVLEFASLVAVSSVALGREVVGHASSQSQEGRETFGRSLVGALA